MVAALVDIAYVATNMFYGTHREIGLKQLIKRKWKKTKKVWNSLTYEQRIAATVYVFQKVCEHARSGGTYRYLIYDRLGFDLDAYTVLYPEGMLISNEFSLSSSGTARRSNDTTLERH